MIRTAENPLSAASIHEEAARQSFLAPGSGVSLGEGGCLIIYPQLLNSLLECPNGMVKEETFKGIYAQYFPKGAETTQYAHYVFNSFDHDNTGAITFTDFVIGLSVLARGSLQEKLRWAFSLYDINGDGYITKDELSKIVQSIYELMGKAVEPMIEDHTTRDHVDRVFQKLDLNKDGVVTIEEFLDSCQRVKGYEKRCINDLHQYSDNVVKLSYHGFHQYGHLQSIGFIHDGTAPHIVLCVQKFYGCILPTIDIISHTFLETASTFEPAMF
ncbi:kv channel-interacting protein 4 [Caerostris darwini]|uniref:Kv channel-interacting protein 4 n=1 Tax=Caerostris darwini TaxID=1538125 RepID=A0AAV4X7Z6_9ARAC|nr:kv channel-interacting protein 4 [Caerostris darwini]